MPDEIRSPEDEARIDFEAAEWLVLRDRGLTARQQDDFLQWLSADPRHGEWFRRHQQTWRDLDLLDQWRPEHSAEPNPDLLARPRRRLTAWVIPLLAAAAAGAVVLWWLPAAHRAPAGADAPPAPAVTVAHTYENRVLEDGSVVQLNAGAELAVDYRPEERRVRLIRGEAHFQVAKNKARPFIVSAGGVAVRAVGTAFNVKLDAAQVEVLVTEGRVRVNPPDDAARAAPPAGPLMVDAGQRTVVGLPGHEIPLRVSHVSDRDMVRYLAWQPKMLDFNATPLRVVVDEFNLRNATQIRLADPALGDLPIVASFRSDNVDGFVRLLEVSSGVRVERAPGEIVLRRAD